MQLILFLQKYKQTKEAVIHHFSNFNIRSGRAAFGPFCQVPMYLFINCTKAERCDSCDTSAAVFLTPTI